MIGVERTGQRSHDETAGQQEHDGGNPEPPAEPLGDDTASEHTSNDKDQFFVHRDSTSQSCQVSAVKSEVLGHSLGVELC